MNNEEKARVYDDLLRENDFYSRKISRLKSEHTSNIPPHVQKEIDEAQFKISVIVGKLENLFR
jgi:hypothetical protein